MPGDGSRPLKTHTRTHKEKRTGVLDKIKHIYIIHRYTPKAKAPGADGIRLQRSCAIWCLGISLVSHLSAVIVARTLTVWFNPSGPHIYNIYVYTIPTKFTEPARARVLLYYKYIVFIIHI